MGLALPYVEHPSNSLPAVCRPQVSSNHVVYVGEIPRLQTIPMDFQRLPPKGPTDETGYDRCILRVRVLSRSINIEITKAHRFDPIEFGEDLAVVFAGEL